MQVGIPQGNFDLLALGTDDQASVGNIVYFEPWETFPKYHDRTSVPRNRYRLIFVVSRCTLLHRRMPLFKDPILCVPLLNVGQELEVGRTLACTYRARRPPNICTVIFPSFYMIQGQFRDL